jgi:hypothetical protein
MRFVHAADLHIDSPLRGLERYEGAPVELIRGATRRAVEHLVDMCLRENAKLLVLSGDLYDGDWRDYSTGLFFCRQMARLREADVTVVWIRGNHDAASRLTQHLRPPENVHELSHSRPVTLELQIDEVPVAVHGQGFPKAKVVDDLSERYPPPVSGGKDTMRTRRAASSLWPRWVTTTGLSGTFTSVRKSVATHTSCSLVTSRDVMCGRLGRRARPW